MRILRENTATRITVGPFLDVTDGFTPEIALTVTGIHLTLMVDDVGVPTLVLDADATASGGNNDMVHVTNDNAGFYDLELTAANTNFTGRAMLACIDDSDHLPVFHEFQIVRANVYDSLFIDSDTLDIQVAGTDNIALSAQQKLDVNTEADTALTGYAGPTKTQMDTAHGLLATEAKQDTMQGNVTDIIADTADMQPRVALIEIDTNEMQGKLPATKFMGSSDGADDDGTLNAITAAGPTKNEMDTAHGLLATESKQDTAQTDLDTLTDNRGHPAQGAPGTSIGMAEKVDYLYKFLVLQKTGTSTQLSVFNVGAGTIDHKSTVSKTGGTYKEEEWVSG